MHEKLYDLLKLLLGLVTPLNVVEGNVDVFGSDLVVTTAPLLRIVLIRY